MNQTNSDRLRLSGKHHRNLKPSNESATPPNSVNSLPQLQFPVLFWNDGRGDVKSILLTVIDFLKH
jgi:hypothetical protein